MISVVVPAYNAAQTISKCVGALTQQSIPRDKYEIIVVDDGSTDETAAVAEAAGAQAICQSNHGPAAARNRGVAAARGDLILFTDADCEPAPDWIAEMVWPFSDSVVVGVKGAYRTHQWKAVSRLVQCEFEERYDRLERLPFIDFVDTYSAAFRASALRQVGGFDPAFPHANNEDVDFSYRLARQGCRLVFNRRALVYHHHADRWLAYLRLKIKRGYWRLVVYRLHPGKALRDSYTPQLLKVQIVLVLLCAGWAVMVLIWPVLWWGVAASFFGLGLSTVPFTRLVLRRDPKLAVLAPLFIAGRAVAFAVGVLGGLVGMLFFRSALSAPEASASD